MSLSDRILASKLLAPRTGVRLLARPRLLEKFTDYQSRKLTLISAPAGYGKTVLISQFAGQVKAQVVWYQLDHFDNDLALFVQHLLAGIEKHLPGLGVEIMDLVERGTDLQKELRRITTALVNSLTANLEEEMILVIDDYHAIEEEAVHGFMEQLLEYLPDKVHMVLSSRTLPPLHLGRLKIAGLMEEINLEDLRFRTDEISGFLLAENNEPVSGETISYLDEETGGWAAALRLAGLSINSVKVRQKASARRTNSHRKEIYHYLASEVLQNLPQDLADFVQSTAVLDFMTPQICDLFLDRDDSYEVLDSLEEQNLFAVVGEGDVYRYHHLFRDFLLSRLGEKKSNLLQKAGQCYLQAGYPVRAVECFLGAGDFGRAVHAVENVAGTMLLHSRWQTVRRWLQSIPEDIKQEHPKMLLFEGVVLLNSGRLEQAEGLIRQAAEALAQTGDQDGIFQTKLYLARILRSRGDYGQSMQMLEEILPQFAGRPVAEWYDMTMEYSLVLGMRGELDKAVHLLNQALTLAEQEGEVHIAAQLVERLGEIHFIKGDYSKAVTVHHRAAEMAPEQERQSFLLRDSIATIYHDWGDLDQALEYAQNSLKAKEQLGMTEALPYALQQLAVVQAALGQFDVAEENFMRSIDLAGQLGGEIFFQARSKALYGRFLGSRGRLEEARQLVDEALEMARGQSQFIYAVCLQAAAPVFIWQGEPQKGAAMLEQALSVLEQIGAKYSICVTCAFLALAKRQLGEDAAAQNYAVRCLELAAPESCIQLFVANPEMMLPVVRVGLEKGLAPEFVKEIIRRMGEQAAEMLAELAVHPDPAVRRRVIAPLAIIGREQAVKKMLSDVDEGVRDQALAVAQTFAQPPKAEARPVKQETQPHPFAREACLQVSCLGAFHVSGGEKEVAWRTTKARDLFAYLIHHREKPVQKEKILEDLWPETDPEQASTLFHTNLYQLRRAVKNVAGEQPVRHKSGQYRLDEEMFSCDIHRFESLAQAAGKAVAEVDAQDLEEAVALYRGEYLEGIDYDWVAAERERLNQLYLQVLDRLAHYYAAEGQYSRAASCLRAILRANPLLEEAHALLMQVYAGMGDRMAVLQQYETLTEVLEEELGVDPSPKTRELYYKLCSEEE
ncbi:BTAD domain-containing putative transcriptional regulator [Dethiobacter alkaliphilus]|uniref:Transcriptional activator domain protein n=1 Tax=Dethiobacter alkaliphilus AHT 1 TaxID=555088 RepID=C0GFP5_DETAL|nr:BTAD domain-containing putative transcriptional regulator [Dethiobacter alkaliphilus]EEG78005.1 transcriptional activator domain protein [Dethiobacter alkaliphilus AHT 1]